jgi:hypothetical protein
LKLRAEPVPYPARIKIFCQRNSLDAENGW